EDGRIIVLQSGTLALRTADVFDTGLYHCIGTNRAAAAALPFRITVLDPHVEHGAVNGARLPAAPGSTLHLPCTSTAAPDAAVTWVLPEHTILRQSVGNKHIFANGTLRIQGVTERDVGYFRCVAANRYGVDLLVFQVLMRQDETALKKKHGAVGEWEEGSGNELLRSAVAQTHPSASPATPAAHGPSAASSQGTQSARRRNSHGKVPRWPYGDRTGRRFRGHRRQFVSSGRRVDPQLWAALLEKTKRNVTVTDKQAEVATEPPIQVHKLSEVPEDEEETSGDLISPEEEFMIPATERSPVPALGRATKLAITAGPEETTDPTPARNTSLLLTEPLPPLPSPLPHSVAPGSKRPNPTDSSERSDLSQISADGVKQSTVLSRTSTLFPPGQKSINSEESNNQHLKSAPMTPTTEATGTSKVLVTPQSTDGKLQIFTESTDKVSTKTDHQDPVATVKAPSSEFDPIYFHSTQKGGTPKPPLASTSAAYQQIQVIQDVPTHPPQLQQHYGRRRKISGQRRIVRPGRIPSMKEQRYNFGRPGSARGSTAVATGVHLNMNYVSNVPTLNNSSSSIDPFSPEAPRSPPSTMNMPLEHPLGAHQNTAFLGEEENKRSARQKAAATGMSVTAKDTATTATSGLGAMGLKPTVTLVITPQTDTRVTKSKIFRAGGRRGQRRKRPPKAPAPRHVATASTATPTVTAATSPAVPPSPTPAKPLPGSAHAVPMTKTAALWIPGTPEAPQHRPTAATETSATLGTRRSTQAAASLPGSLTAQSHAVALQTTPATQRNTQLATSPPTSSAQTPTTGLQTSPCLDEPPGATSARPAAVRATPEPVPAQHIRATAAAGEKSHLKMGEGVVQENQAAQATLAARTVSSAPAAVTAPSTRHPSPLP
ncbi:IGS10 protein, partial [Erpornis zantholeuca]|nr:IGS10 protein [Erpornis zantholeuca]